MARVSREGQDAIMQAVCALYRQPEVVVTLLYGVMCCQLVYVWKKRVYLN